MSALAIGRAVRLWLPRLWLWMLLVSLAACAGLPQQAAVSQEELALAAGGAGLLPAGSEPVAEDLPSLLYVTPEMRRFARDAVGGRMELADRTEALMQALGEGKGLHVRYDAEATLTAEQAFAQRRANCLSYTMLFVALAREVGIPAQFNEVDIPPIWDLGDDRTSLLYLHINARVELPLRFYQVVDVSGEEIDPSYKQQVIADAEAQAQFYNNRAAQLRLQQRPGDALRYEVRALELAPDAAYLWTNLASLYLLRGEARAARIAITQSLQLDSTSLAGYDTAAAVYRKLGEPKLALYFQQRAEYFLDQNPYRHYQLALEALLRQDKREAFEQARRAILLYPKDARFFFLMAVVENQLGDMDRAEESLRVAVLLEPDAARQERYKSKFARLVGERG